MTLEPWLLGAAQEGRREAKHHAGPRPAAPSFLGRLLPSERFPPALDRPQSTPGAKRGPSRALIWGAP